MTACLFSLRSSARCAALVLPALLALAARADDVVDRDCLPHLTRQEQRLLERAADGTDALRRFVFIRRAILQVDVFETAVWAESVRSARAACRQTLPTAAAE